MADDQFDEKEFEKTHKEANERIAEMRRTDPRFDMAYCLGSLQAKSAWAVKMMRLGADNCKNSYIRGMLRKEAAELRKFLVEECKMDIPFDPRYDV